MTTPVWLAGATTDPLAAAFAEFAWRAHEASLEPARRDAIARIALLLAVERARGHGAVHADDWAGARDHPELPGFELPDAALWNATLDDAAWVGDGTRTTPLVRRADGSVALFRDDVAERSLARALRAMVEDVREGAVADGTREAFARLFPEAPPEGAALAAVAALRSRLTVITGGPGTGKTTTVVRILALLLSEDPSLRVAIAAPTGKAASRLRQSIDAQRATLPVDDAVRAAIPAHVDTVHRLLGYRPHDETFGFDARRRLPVDVVAVDEASMLDLGLAGALVAALPAHARLILLGDRDQLASVDAGAVLEDLVDARSTTGDKRSPDFAAFARGLFVDDPPVDARADVFADATVELRHNFRFRDQPAIAGLAEALRDGDADTALHAFDGAALTRLDVPSRADELVPTIDAWLDRVSALRPDDEDEHVRLVESRLRLLSALREGPWGVTGLNRLVEARLASRGWDVRDPWYHGRPVMVLRNVRSLELANGDVGVCRHGRDGTRTVVLRDGDGGLRHLPVATLPAHETAWAMTVHKSQGSEFEHVLMVLPPEGHPLATRSLLYTGVTRARRSVTVVGSTAAIRAAVEAKERRRTALTARLRDA